MTALTVAFRRRRPEVAVVVALVGATIAARSGGNQLLALPLAIALDYYALGQGAGARGGWTLVDGLLVVLPLPGIATDPGTPKSGDILLVDIVSVWTFFIVLPFVVGRVVGARRRLILALQDSAEGLAVEQRENEVRAAANERTRIARELHDVIAHSVSVMVIQTQAARLVAASDRQGAVNALCQVEQCGRDALFDVRRMIGVLRRDDGDVFPAVRPGIAQLDNLVDRTRVAGLPVHLRVPVRKERPRERLAIGDRPAMRRQVARIGGGDDLLQRGEVFPHRTVGCGHQRRAPPHHVVAREIRVEGDPGAVR